MFQFLQSPYLELPQYVHSHRQNLFYLSKRVPLNINPIESLTHKNKYNKGEITNNKKEESYWFNAENQFQSHHHSIEKKWIINSHTSLEESSLYQFDDQMFQSSHPLFPYTIFYICRK